MSPSARSWLGSELAPPIESKNGRSTVTAIFEPHRRSVGTLICSCGISLLALDERQSGRRTAFGKFAWDPVESRRFSNSDRMPRPEKYTACISSPNHSRSPPLVLATTKSIFPAGLFVRVPCMKETSRASKASSVTNPTTSASHRIGNCACSKRAGQTITGSPAAGPSVPSGLRSYRRMEQTPPLLEQAGDPDWKGHPGMLSATSSRGDRDISANRSRSMADRLVNGLPNHSHMPKR